MRLNDLYPYIVPLTFLAIWALTSLFNRDAQPLPPRNAGGRPFGPPGPAPGQRPAPVRPGEVRTEFASRFVNPPGQRPPYAPPPRPQQLGDDKDIVILETEVRKVPPGQGGSRSSNAPGRKLQKPPKAPRSAGLKKADTTGGLEHLERPPSSMPPATALTKLSIADSPLNAPSTLAGTKTESISRAEPDGRALTSDQIRELFTSPQRLRESILLSMVIAPPPGARRGPFARRWG